MEHIDLYNLSILIKYACIEYKYKILGVEFEDLIYYMTKYNNHIIQNNFTLYYKLIEQYLIPIIKISMKSHPHQQIIWLRLHTSVDQFYRGSFNNEMIDIYNNAISHTLK